MTRIREEEEFRRDLKTHLFEWHCVSFSALAVFLRNALCKSTFYLLTHLLFTYYYTIVAVWWLCLETIGVTVAHRLFLRHLGHVIGVKIARRLCLRLGVTIATAFPVTFAFLSGRWWLFSASWNFWLLRFINDYLAKQRFVRYIVCCNILCVSVFEDRCLCNSATDQCEILQIGRAMSWIMFLSFWWWYLLI